MNLKTGKTRIFLVVIGTLIAACLCLVIVVSLLPKTETTANPTAVTAVPTTANTLAPTSTTAPTSAPAPTATQAAAAVPDRCVPASKSQFANILDGVTGKDAQNSIKTAWAVKSTAFENVWVIAAKIYGPGMENGTGPGIWAISGDPDKPGLTLSVDGFAKNFTNYPDGSKTDAATSITDDGVAEAKACAEQK